MTKKGHQKFLRMKIENLFWEIGKIFLEVCQIFRKQGESERGRKCIIASGAMDAPGGLYQTSSHRRNIICLPN